MEPSQEVQENQDVEDQSNQEIKLDGQTRDDRNIRRGGRVKQPPKLLHDFTT